VTPPSRRRDLGARLGLGLAAALGAVLALVTPACAGEFANPLAGGESALHMKRGFLKELERRGIALEGDFPGSERTLSLAVVGGALDPVDGKGSIEQAGILRLTHRGRSVVIAKIDADTASGIVRGKVAGAKMKFGFLAQQSSERAGFGVNVRSKALRLSGKAARLISNRLGLGQGAGLAPGRALSNLYSETQPRTVAVVPCRYYCAFLSFQASTDAAYTKMFANGQVPLGIEPSWTHFPMGGPLTYGMLNFAVTGGPIALDASYGSLDFGGGMRIAMPAAGRSVDRTNITLDLGGKVCRIPKGRLLGSIPPR
jgi:hypothetical protein